MNWVLNAAQWKVVWGCTILVVGLWLGTASWSDLAIPGVEEQRSRHEAGAVSREARWRAQRTEPMRREYSDNAFGRTLREFDVEDQQRREASALTAVHAFTPDRRGEQARIDIAIRVGVSVVVVGLLLVWQLAGKRAL